ncbi:MAG: hypothetical protein HUJ77_13095 [Clostridium sp.]|uniref:FxLYD domain-containing protein n=1 Tax=Clostridium sp. TaxID=1506 RepID=UPI0025B835E7|nr:FxLYD domain-containing protein [Clostridium sp.]MCF0149317.1 hypothetical protein [Clostridium sp.]
MKRKYTCIFSIFILTISLFGCSSAAKEPKVLTDTDFIVNMGKALEARWKFVDSSESSSEVIEKMSTSEYQSYLTKCVTAETDILKSYDDYVFENEDLAKLAKQYFFALELQKEGVKYARTNNYLDYEQTFDLGYNYRVVLVNDLYENFDLKVNEKYSKNLNDFIALSSTSKKFISIQEFVNSLSETLSYTKDEEKSNEYSTYYKAIIENTTDYTIDSLTIEIDFLDASGVVINQTSDHLKNLTAGKKIESSILIKNENFESMEFTITAYNN